MRVTVPNLKWAELPIWIRTVQIITGVNFVAFWLISVFNDGDALTGRIAAGHYFIGSHGRYTEVSKTFFEYSRIHGLSIFITVPLAILAVAWFMGRHPDAKCHGWPFKT